MFCNCNKLSSLPHISKWNINKVTNMSKIFYQCNKLKDIPKFSKENES